MAWAGKHSENIASVYLLYHLMDKLSFANFWKVCHDIGCSPKNFSSPSHFVLFVRDTLGLLVNSPLAREIQYHKIIEECVLDLIFEGRNKEAELLKDLPYGRGFEKEQKKYRRQKTREDSLRFQLLSHNFVGYAKRLRSWDASPHKKSFRFPPDRSFSKKDRTLLDSY
jgi:hypothetical protein